MHAGVTKKRSDGDLELGEPMLHAVSAYRRDGSAPMQGDEFEP
jgi:hypothetical protein